MRDYFDALYPAFTACVIMTVIVLALRYALPADWAVGVRLGLQSTCGALAYTSILLGGFRPRVSGLYRVIREARAS